MLVVIAATTIICGGDGLHSEGAMIRGPKTEEGLRGLITIRGQIRKLMVSDGASRASTEESMAAAVAFLPAESKDQKETAPAESKDQMETAPAETRLEPEKQGPGNWHVRESLHYVPSSPDPIQNR